MGTFGDFLVLVGACGYFLVIFDTFLLLSCTFFNEKKILFGTFCNFLVLFGTFWYFLDILVIYGYFCVEKESMISFQHPVHSVKNH